MNDDIDPCHVFRAASSDANWDSTVEVEKYLRAGKASIIREIHRLPPPLDRAISRHRRRRILATATGLALMALGILLLLLERAPTG